MATETSTTPAATGHPSGEPIVRDKLYIGGAWVDPDGTGTIDVIDATTEEVIGRVPEGSIADAERAAQAARAAFARWSETSTTDRAELCQRVAALLAARGDEIAELIAREVGMPVGLSRMIQAGLPTMSFGSMPA